ncbi:MAG: hypothetical protein KBD19_03725 [Candidatus Moranbacteria bacterium]|nr:hypothetical protein [Candidatus Moranbacteria bacterium]
MNISSTKSRRTISSAFALALVMQLVFPMQLLAMFGGGPKIPSPSKVAKEMEQRYHINTESVQNIGEGFNVADSKKTTPEVSVFFSPSDPREGQKITAKAFPMYFSNENQHLYYTWYLKRTGCDLGPAGGKPAYCNADGSGNITVNDWKVAAGRILATDNADKAGFDYGSSTDSDSYSAQYGGGNQVNTSGDWCYLADQSSGTIYELVTKATSDSYTCGALYEPGCVSGSDTIDPAAFNASASADALGNSSVSVVGSTFVNTSTYESVGSPDCKNNTPTCPSGTVARCILKAKMDSTFDYNADTAGIGCTSGSVVAGGSKCSFHLFPWPDTNLDGNIAAGEKNDSGDGAFGVNEENFWGTNPNDPDTADNGNKDEANVVGLGRDTFTWNYQQGDMLGVVVEGVSMITTKHSDSSSAIMWAFPKNDCAVLGKGSYSQTIKGYSVKIPTTDMTVDDVNACLDDNLLDPLEGGQGSSKKLEVEVSATPENPVNDETTEGWGDTVSAFVSVSNSSRASSELSYDWTVSISDNPNTGWKDITANLKTEGLLQNSAGNGLDSISIELNMQTAFLTPLGFNGVDPLYLKIAPTVKENFSNAVVREGKSDVIVRVLNTTNKIVAYRTSAELAGGSYKVTFDSDLAPAAPGVQLAPMCNNYYGDLSPGALALAGVTLEEAVKANLNRIACRVVKNEIIGLKFSDEAGLSDFRWTLNDRPVTCSTNVSAACGNGVFFAVAGNPGETYSIKASAVDTATGKSVTLVRTFQIVEPEVVIESDDLALSWPKYVGSHTDLAGNVFDEYSDVAFETEGAGNIKLKARFLPGSARFLSSDFGPDLSFGTADDVSRRIWLVDDIEVPETAPGSLAIDYAPVTPKVAGEVYNISFNALLVQPVEKRQALKDIWGIDTLASSEIRVSQSIQMDVVELEYIVQGPKKFFAAISSYLPASILFAFKITLSMALLLFTVGFVFALIPAEPRTDEVILSRRS